MKQLRTEKEEFINTIIDMTSLIQEHYIKMKKSDEEIILLMRDIYKKFLDYFEEIILNEINTARQTMQQKSTPERIGN